MRHLVEFEVFLDELKQQNSTKYKQSVLEKFKGNKDIEFMLRYIFSPYIVNGISRKKLQKNLCDETNSAASLSSKDVLLVIAGMQTGSDKAVKLVQDFSLALSHKHRKLFLQIVMKDLPIGLGVLTINKVIPDLLPTFSVMLATKYEDNKDYVLDKEFNITRKIDGSRIVMLKEEGVVKFYTRAGQLYEGLVELELDALKLPDNIMLDGELTLAADTGLDNKTAYKETMKISRKKGIKTGLKMLVFDTMPVNDFYMSYCDMKYSQRRELLNCCIAPLRLAHFEVLPELYRGKDLSKIDIILNQQIALGEEGIMINIVNSYYSFNRTKDLLKVKKMHDIDLEIIALEEGLNSNRDSLGAFIVSYKGFQVKVGSGIDKKTRKEVWSNQDEFIGRVIKVQYFEETTNQQGGKSLRFPVFLGFRDDKEGDI